VAIDPIAATGGMYATAPTRAPKQSLDGEAFMTLLVTQLRNQDPSSPMDTNQMISQTTQLAMMEKMTALTTTSDENFSLQMRTAAASLLGQIVSYHAKDGSVLSGTPSSVSYAGSVPQISIGGVDVPLDAILSIATKTA
jgi:flagellar basal-body rod modification protein FlgD